MASQSSEPGSGAGANPALSEEDLALLERVAARVVALRMEVPAILTLESGKPLSLLASQTLHFFEPMVTAMLRLPDYRRFARLIERREVIETLIRRIEAQVDARGRERREAADRRRASRAPGS